MHLVSFSASGRARIGALTRDGRELVDLAAAAPELPPDMLGLIALGDAGLAAVRQALDGGHGRLALERVRLLAPIPRPAREILCVGKNYREHVKEVQRSGSMLGKTDTDDPEVPIIFTKASAAVIGPGVPIPVHLDPTATADYEGELAVVIGRGGRGIRRADAMAHIYGYTIINDVTSRRLQRAHRQWFLGKSIDGFCPMGPALVTRDAVPDLDVLCIETRVNGELRQDSPITEMIFDIPTLIETLSRTMTLEPGDILATGTPAGVGMGFQPPKWLQSGDRVTIRIAPIGVLENPVA
jgi:2-keto-4-pentenoate hydratase/2-oxohepta-3-ene-1,7-dioic acid hydratase in catechol pathway